MDSPELILPLANDRAFPLTPDGKQLRDCDGQTCRPAPYESGRPEASHEGGIRRV